jgi:hypothetical protein
MNANQALKIERKAEHGPGFNLVQGSRAVRGVSRLWQAVVSKQVEIALVQAVPTNPGKSGINLMAWLLFAREFIQIIEVTI